MTVEPNVSVCSPWVSPEEVSECESCTDVEVSADIIYAASGILYHLSRRLFPGSCTRTIRPCRKSLRFDHPVNQSVEGWNSSWGICTCGYEPGISECSCGPLSEIILGGFPVTDIVEVLIDGSVIPSSDYAVHDFRRLVRLTDEGWPCCQDLRKDPSSEDNTFQITFKHGIGPPPEGKLAARVMACQLQLACSGSDNCQLPKRIQLIARQGVTLIDPFQFLKEKKTGIYEIDLFLNAYNPNGLTEDPVAISPDVPLPDVQVTWTGGS